MLFHVLGGRNKIFLASNLLGLDKQATTTGQNVKELHCRGDGAKPEKKHETFNQIKMITERGSDYCIFFLCFPKGKCANSDCLDTSHSFLFKRPHRKLDSEEVQLISQWSTLIIQYFPLFLPSHPLSREHHHCRCFDFFELPISYR